jgi:hypothetical protein
MVQQLEANQFFVGLAFAARELLGHGLYHWVGEHRVQDVLPATRWPDHSCGTRLPTISSPASLDFVSELRSQDTSRSQRPVRDLVR